jgi:hypothetical protein
MAQETPVQDRAIQPIEEKPVSTLASLLPSWPHSKPGPQVTAPPTGMKPAVPDRPEQVCADDAVFIPFDPDNFEINTSTEAGENETSKAPSKTAQEGFLRRPRRL